MRHPLVPPLIALIAGIVAARFAQFFLPETLFSISILAILAAAGLRKGSLAAGMAALLTAFALLGGLLGSNRPDDADSLITTLIEREAPPPDDPVRLRGYVREPTEALEDADRFVLETEAIFHGIAARGGVRVTVYRDPDAPPLELAYGDRVEMLARPRPLHNYGNPGSFDRVRHLNRQGIHLTATLRPGTPIHRFEGRGGWLAQSWVWSAREAARTKFEAIFPEAEQPSPATGILRAMVLGDRATLDREVEIEFQKTGTFHALVVSGLHVGILAFAVIALLRLTAIPPLLQSALAIAIVAGYALLAGANVPVIRASWMVAAYLLTRMLYRQRRALNVIASTALIFLAIDPELMFDAGFQMSFLSVALIAGLAAPLLERTLDPFRRSLGGLANVDLDLHLAPRVAQCRVSLRRALDPLAALIGAPRRSLYLAVCGCLRIAVWAAELCVVSLVVQAGMALPMAIHFQRVSLSGISANLLVIPLLTATVPLGLAAIAFGWRWAAALALWCAESIARVVAWHAENIPVDPRVPPPPVWLGVVFGASLCWAALSFKRGRMVKLASSGAALLALAVLVVHPFAPALQRGMLELTAIDVGQGESLFLGLPGGRTMLVDGGGLPSYGGSVRSAFDIGEAVVSPYLWSRSIRRLDVIAVTHADTDHTGGVPALLENFEVGELWLANGPDDERMLPLLETARRRGVAVRRLRQGDSETLGAVAIEVLSPVFEQETTSRQNDDSLVLRAVYGSQSFLLTGDIERRAEQALLSGPLLGPQTVLKLAHHGSRTSTSPQFLDRVQPSFAIVSSGYRNGYGHPHPDVIRRLKRHRVCVLRTDQDGLVSVATDGDRLFVSTFRWEQPGRNPAPLAPLADARE